MSHIISPILDKKKSKGIWISLKVKIIISLLVIIFCAINVVMIIISQKTEEIIEYVKTQHIEEGALSLRNRISAALEQSGRDIVFMATLPIILQSIELSSLKNPNPKDTEKRNYLMATFIRARLTYSYYNALWLMDEKGKVIAGSFINKNFDHSVNNKKELADIVSKNTLVLGDALYSNVGNLMLPVYLKVLYNGKKGIIAGKLQVNKLARQALYELKRPLVNAYIMNSQGKIVTKINDKEAELINSLKSSLLAPKPKSISGRMVVTLGNAKKDIYYHHIPRTNLYAVIVADSTYMHNYVEEIRKTLLIIGFILTLLLIASIFLFIFPLTRDIKSLSLFAEKTKNFKPAPIINIKRNDELGDLAHSLTDMVSTLTNMLEKTKEAAKAKSDFLAHMSHEIRTPMNAIIGMTYLALQEKPNKKQYHFLKRIDSAAKNLLAIINDVLDFSKIDAKKMIISSVPFNLKGMIISIHDLLEISAREKNLRLTYYINDDVPKAIYGDQVRLSQICINLGSNALKFTDRGSVDIHVSVEKREDDIFTLLFSIKDTGIGINIKSQKQIFESFSQADNSSTRKYDGTGLGLSISKSLANMMGGNMWLNSEIDKGSTFYFTIQAKSAPLESVVKSNRSYKILEVPNLTNIHILLAEDNLINQEIATALLNDLGATVSIANNGIEALTIWKDNYETIDIILMDIQMPVMDGLTASRRIRESNTKKSKDIPIIALTANAMSGDKEKSLEAGMNEHTTKPIDIDELHAILAYWTSISKKNPS